MFAVLTFTCLHVTEDLLSHVKVHFYCHLPTYALVEKTLTSGENNIFVLSQTVVECNSFCFIYFIFSVYMYVCKGVCVCDIILCVYMTLGRVHSMNMEVKGKVSEISFLSPPRVLAIHLKSPGLVTN